jgi:hypothetical protein
MKKTLTLTIALILTFFVANAQILINESFSSGVFPPAGWSIEGQAANWSANISNNAGGQAPEARMTWTPAFNGVTRFVMPAKNLSVINSDYVILSFKHMVQLYTSSFIIGVSYRISGGAWSTVWSQAVSGSIDAQTKEIIVNDPAIMNSENVEFALYFSGNSYNIDDWYIDDVMLMAPSGLDLALIKIDVADVFYNSTPLTGTLKNFGAETVTSFDLSWRINYGSVNTISFSGLSIESFEEFVFDAETSIVANPGNYNLNVYISNINGQGSDDNSANDFIIKEFQAAHNVTTRKPLFESFTSSTCPPCYTFNTNFFNNFTTTNANDITLIKYQMNWPGSGDPYYNADGGIRRTYYGVNSVPMLFFEGNGITLNSAIINNALLEALSKPSFVALETSYFIEGDMIKIYGNAIPYADLGQAQLHVAVLERVTTGNAMSNGETSFKHVMHKMLPGGQGTEIELNAMQAYNFVHEFDMSDTNVEEMDDLIVLVFVQNNSTKEIYQSQYANPAEAPVATFNIINESVNIEINKLITISFNQPVRDTDGSALTVETAKSKINFSGIITKADVDFDLEINTSHTVFTITPVNSLDFITNYSIEVLPLMGVTGEISESQSVNFISRDLIAAPTANFEVIDGQENVDLYKSFIVMFDQKVRNVDGEEFTAETAAERIIFKQGDETGEDVEFTVEINTIPNMFTISHGGRLAFLQEYYLEVLPLMGVDDEVSTSASITFTTRPSIGAPSIVFNVEDGEIDVDVNRSFMIIFSQSMRNTDESELTNANAANSIIFKADDAAGEDVDFSVVVSGDKKQIIVTPDSRLDFVADYYLEVLELMGYEDDITTPTSVAFTTRESIGAPGIEFNVEEGEEDVLVNTVFTITFSQSVRDINGEAFTTTTAAENIIFQAQDSEYVSYTVAINAGNNVFTITPSENLSSLTTYQLTVLPVMGTDDDISDEASVTFTTEEVVGISELSLGEVAIFPNPANDFIVISLPESSVRYNISIYDISGKMIISKTANGQSLQIDISSFKEGLYIIKMTDGVNVYSGKFNRISK